ncbi:DUF6445 family protein [Arenimonas composti]|uniref:Prolyl 4-hydroxylase alpha subunit Fe(2+) 2OG dioxygenase domain-containing protein n=1 Tax=Arenimonas composti TR7-09 = DSM 18010 TaxID=1121013 RepID=A0A091BV91_9GAMM|nr:DUF6445 family protein [Arenimonas composti]KFN48255.1 hypothetical protein P873_01480 [Arenimonas composti TR7-09 = DSM 18010]
MNTSLLIVDDFLANAEALRAAALRMDFPPVDGMFPGRNSRERLLIEGLDAQVSRLLGECVEGMPGPQAHGRFRLALAGDRGRAGVHVDAAHWSGILYLTPNEHARGGTEFYRHRPTGFEVAPSDDADALRFGHRDAKSMVSSLLASDTLDPSKWELTMRVPMRFNRLVLFRPWLWHTAGENFGTTPEDGRLVYLMFFRSAAALCRVA